MTSAHNFTIQLNVFDAFVTNIRIFRTGKCVRSQKFVRFRFVVVVAVVATVVVAVVVKFRLLSNFLFLHFDKRLPVVGFVDVVQIELMTINSYQGLETTIRFRK